LAGIERRGVLGEVGDRRGDVAGSCEDADPLVGGQAAAGERVCGRQGRGECRRIEYHGSRHAKRFEDARSEEVTVRWSYE